VASRELQQQVADCDSHNGIIQYLLIGFDRHRGGGHPPTPATPPCVRVRTRRFEMVTLVPIRQMREAERVEIGRGKRDG
jgi:predicted nucleic acid-binding OB-fold protein